MECGRWDDVGKLVGEPRQQRSGIISALYAGERPMCRLPSVLQLQYRGRTADEIPAPLAQSVERIHGKENSGLFSSSGDQQEQPFVQVIAHRSIWIK